MPFSWVRVSSGTSPKVRNCMGSDHSKKKFAECVDRIVGDDGGRIEQIHFEQNGAFARVHFWWDTIEQKERIIHDLEAEEVIDLITVEEADALASADGSAS